MITLRISAEMFTGLFTPGVMTMHECVDGLPEESKLIGLTFNADMNRIECLFEDGKPELQVISVKYARNTE